MSKAMREKRLKKVLEQMNDLSRDIRRKEQEVEECEEELEQLKYELEKVKDGPLGKKESFVWNDREGDEGRVQIDPAHAAVRCKTMDDLMKTPGVGQIKWPEKTQMVKVKIIDFDMDDFMKRHIEIIHKTLYDIKYIYTIIEELTGEKIFDDDDWFVRDEAIGKEIEIEVKSPEHDFPIMILGKDWIYVVAPRIES